MPYHKIPRASAHEVLRTLVRQQEIIVSVVPSDDPGFYDVITRDRTEDELETRGGAA